MLKISILYWYGFEHYNCGITVAFPMGQWVNTFEKRENMGVPLITWASCQIRKIAGCACAGNAGNGLAIPTCITARAWRTCRDACRDRKLVVSFDLGGVENVPGIPGACATRNFTYLARGPLPDPGIKCFNSLRSSDAICCHGTWSTLARPGNGMSPRK